MSQNEKRRKKSYHVRFNSSPYIGKATNLKPIRSSMSSLDVHSDSDDEEEETSHSTLYPLQDAKETMQSLKMIPQHTPHQRGHMKSASFDLENLAQIARKRPSDIIAYASDDVNNNLVINVNNIDAHQMNNDLSHFHMQKYTKKEQEELMAIQVNLKKWIGDEESLILSQFLDLMEKIAPHISTAEATEMFNKMDPFNNGQIKTNILLHDEFLPRMILNLFKTEEEDTESVLTRTSTLPDDFGLDEDEDDIDDKTKIKTLKAETRKLKKWIMDKGQPAIEKVDELQMMLDVYEDERKDSQFELQSFNRRLSHLGEIEDQLKQTRSHSTLLLQEHDSLLLSVHESTKQRELDKKKFFQIKKECEEYKKLSVELKEINDKYKQKYESLSAVHTNLTEENQNLRQLLLQYETETTEHFQQSQQEIETIKNEMKSLQNKLENTQKGTDGVQFNIMDGDDDNNNNDGSFRRQRKRRMTNPDTNSDGDMNGKTLDLEMATGDNKKSRRNTIRMWYETHVRRASQQSLPSSHYLYSMQTQTPHIEMKPEHSDDTTTTNENNVNNMDRQDSSRSIQSTVSVATAPYMYKYGSNDDHTPMFKYVGIAKQDSANSHASTTHPLNVNSLNASSVHHDDIFEDAIAQELRIELRKQIEGELEEDYKLKLQQKDIEFALNLHREKAKLEVNQREIEEKYEQKLDQLNLKLAEAKKQGLLEGDIFDNDEMVYLNSSVSKSDDEKDAYDDGQYSLDSNDEDEEKRVLMQREKKEKDEYIRNVVQNQQPKNKKNIQNKNHTQNNRDANKDESCFSCFGLFAGSGV